MLFHGFYILSTQPLIVSFIGDIYLQGRVAIDRPKNQHYQLPPWFKPKFVINHIGGWSVPWHRMGKHKVRQVAYSVQGMSHHLLVNAFDEEVIRKRFWMQGGHFSHNIYVNEHLYKPLAEPKKYDAVYTAQLQAFKRLPLAKDVEKLMVISYGGDLHAFCPELKHADFNREFLPREELVRLYNQSYAGLCLSAVEGAMFASCEYLLCGIPVVSTPSKGGRDEFFTAENSKIVLPEAEAVATAVEYWKSHPPDPCAIREETLQQMNRIRLEYCEFISDLIKVGGGEEVSSKALMETYFSEPDGMLSRFIKLKDIENSNLQDYKIEV